MRSDLPQFEIRMWRRGVTPLGGEMCIVIPARDANAAELDARLDYPQFNQFDVHELQFDTEPLHARYARGG